MEKNPLPQENQLGFYEMRFESVGGLGANLAGQILAQAAVLKQGYNGAHFSSYGSEKKGSPVKSNIRICSPGREVRTSSPVEKPHLLAIFHHCLLRVEGTLSGMDPETILLVNTPDTLEEVREKARLPSGTLGVLDALAIAVEEGTRINAAMLGAVVRLVDFLDREAVKETLAESFGQKYAHLLKANLKTFDRGYEQVRFREIPFDGKFEAPPQGGKSQALGYANTPLGGTILNPGNTRDKDLSASRQGIYPFYHRDRCIDCGLCTQTCPDYVFVWNRGTDSRGKPAQVLQGPNYQYCKGCLKCVEICPVNALTVECERPEFQFTANVQLWGPPDALVSLSRDNEPAKWEQGEGYYWRRVG